MMSEIDQAGHPIDNISHIDMSSLGPVEYDLTNTSATTEPPREPTPQEDWAGPEETVAGDVNTVLILSALAVGMVIARAIQGRKINRD